MMIRSIYWVSSIIYKVIYTTYHLLVSFASVLHESALEYRFNPYVYV